MNKTTILIVAGGVVFAILSAFLVQLVTAPKQAADGQAQVKMVDVLVASKDLKIGEELVADSTSWKSWPQNSVFPGAVIRKDNQANTDALKGRLRRAIAVGEPLMQNALVDDTKSNFVAAALMPGMRAVAIPVSAQSGVSGFISPGDYVDVVMTYTVRLPSDDTIKQAAVPVVVRSAAQTVLENVKVLAVDQETGQQTEAKIGKTVALEVTGKQAEMLALAQTMGKLSLTLRGIGDTGPAINDTSKDKSISKATTDLRLSNVMSELLRGENNTGSANQVVRIYSGNRVETVSVRSSPAH